jgi:acyl dehydratase
MSVDIAIAKIGSVVATLAPPPSSAADLARYARASGDSNPLHLDPEFARKAGFDNLVVHGMLGMAHMGRMLTNAFPLASIRSFTARFSAVILAGEPVRYQATLVEKGGDVFKLSLEAIAASRVVAIKGDAVIDARLVNTVSSHTG